MTSRIAPGIFIALLSSTALAAPGQCPNVMLVLDASGSMLNDASGHEPGDPAFQGDSKWKMLQDVVDECVKQYGDRVSFGVMIYSGGGTDDATCASQCKVQVPIAATSAGAIRKLLRDTTPEKDAQTPTNGAIHVARSLAEFKDSKVDHYIILVTDGDPNCGSDKRYSDPGTHVIDPDVAQYPGTVLGELDHAFHQMPSVRTFVIGFDGDQGGVNPQNLENMGFFGDDKKMGCGTGNTHCYYTAGNNSTEFKQAFSRIITSLVGDVGQECENTCYATGCPDGQVCTTNESFPQPHCEPDPCMGMRCDGDTFCRQGRCVKACTDGCPAGNVCHDGTCVPAPCESVTCAPDKVCDPKTSACVDSPCAICTTYRYCDVATATCVDDQCKVISCPSGTHCVNHGDCQGDGDGTGGCHCRAGGGVSTLFDGGPGLLVLGLLLLRRRTRRAIVPRASA